MPGLQPLRFGAVPTSAFGLGWYVGGPSALANPEPSVVTQGPRARDTVRIIDMAHWKLTLAYDGGPYHGWQVQPGLPTVQGTLAAAVERISGEAVLPQGSGRTDTGVHALGQVASFSLKSPIPAGNLHRALNHLLPASIRVLAVEAVAEDFHARHSALRKTYEYRIFPLRGVAAENICLPMLAPWVWACHWPLDLDALNEAAGHVVGTHDFTSFAAVGADLTTRLGASDCVRDGCGSGDAVPTGKAGNVRTIFRSGWERRDGLLVYTVTGSGFLHHMVRNLVGTFVQAGAHRLEPNWIPAILGARRRSAAGPTAPAAGLFLVSVAYSGDAE